MAMDMAAEATAVDMDTAMEAAEDTTADMANTATAADTAEATEVDMANMAVTDTMDEHNTCLFCYPNLIQHLDRKHPTGGLDDFQHQIKKSCLTASCI